MTDGSAIVHYGDWREVLADVGEVDALICDPPYSARTHGRHAAFRADGSWTRQDGRKDLSVHRRAITYDAWSVDDAEAFCAAWLPRVRGWSAILTDHTLSIVFEQCADNAGRTTFAPIPCVQNGMTVRLGGDGPSSWTVWLCVSRPKSLRAWGTLPGAYVVPGGADRSKNHIGGKPLSLMRQIVSDYTNPGDVVADPCAGYGTTLLAAREMGCHGIGAELDAATHAQAAKRLAAPWQPTSHPRAGRLARKAQVQEPLFPEVTS